MPLTLLVPVAASNVSQSHTLVTDKLVQILYNFLAETRDHSRDRVLHFDIDVDHNIFSLLIVSTSPFTVLESIKILL